MAVWDTSVASGLHPNDPLFGLASEAALLAGRLRAMLPIPPTGPTSRSARERGTKPERRVAWIADIQIAATAWLAGEAVCTADQGHFEALGEAIAKLFPGERKLQVLPPPANP